MLARQSGQAMVMGLLLCAVGALAWTRYFATGQVLADKTEQVDVLDAAAYSAAVVQARALNMLALSNRAMAGHQLAMAHLVTLASGAQLAAYQGTRLAMGNPPGYLIAMLFGASHGKAYAASSAARADLQQAASDGDLGRAYVRHDTLVHETLAAAQDHVVSSLADARLATLHALLQQRYPAGSYQVEIKQDNLPGFIARFDGQSLRPFLLTLANNFRFLDSRDQTARNAWVVKPRCPMLRHELRRRGNTQLDAAGRWQSADTLSYHALRSNPWIGCYYREYAMGWGWNPVGAGQVLDGPHVPDPPTDFSAQDFWRWVAEATNWNIFSGVDNPLANSHAVAMRLDWPGQGFVDYYDVSQPGKRRPLRFVVTLQRKGKGGHVYVSRSAAESFFERPDIRADYRAETDNLFNPYWHARLSAEETTSPGVSS